MYSVVAEIAQAIRCADGRLKSPDIYMPPLTVTEKPQQQRFTKQSGVLINISSR